MSDRYYQDYEDHTDEVLDQRICELLNDTYIHSKFNIFFESLEGASKENVAIIEDYLEQNKYYELGQKLATMSMDLADKYATSHAIENLNSGILDESRD